MASRCVRVLNVCLLTAMLMLTESVFGGAHARGWPGFTIPDGRSIQILNWGNLLRVYRVYRPRGLTGAAPLVVMLHGGFGDGAQAERDYFWNTMADTGRFVVAYPDGLLRAWNAGTCCGVPARVYTDDVGFITTMVASIAGRIPIDPARLYVTGMSNGAMMALRLGCQTNMFAAIAPVAGTLVSDCSGAPPTSLLQIHGTADENVPYNGGPGSQRSLNGTPRVNGPSVPAVNATWRSIDGCAAPTSTTDGVVTTETAACPDGRTVELISIAGAGHQWPGGKSNPLVDKLIGLPTPSTALSATSTIWTFFSQHSH
jgi:polyhydroxybutyrate depolymerase